MDIVELRSGFFWGTLVATACILHNVNGECKDKASWCPEYASRCDQSIYQSPCPFTCGVCTTSTTFRTVTTAVGAGCIGGNCVQQCSCFDSEDCSKRNGRCPYGRCAPGWRGFPDCSRRDCSTNNGGCRQKCVSGRVSDACACWEGYIIQGDGVTCAENDSLCLRDRKGSEYVGTVAVTAGGETCRSWAEVHNTQYDHNYCRNTPGSQDPHPWCMVAPYTQHIPCNISLCSAVDPCHPSHHACPQQCVRTQPSSHSCQCYPGYSGNGKICNDIDECSGNSHGCSSHEQCVNTEGGYYCDCAAGYHLDVDTNQCTDVDECADRESYKVDQRCHKCTNTDGSYECECNEGYKPNSTVRYCVDINECADRNKYRVPDSCHSCNNSDGGFICTCSSGYEPSVNSQSCLDVDECADRESYKVDQRCHVCTNTAGGYTCLCNAGYQLNSTGRYCVECSSGTFGDLCGEDCHCLDDQACNKSDGVCPGNLCAEGWMGTSCQSRGSVGEAPTDNSSKTTKIVLCVIIIMLALAGTVIVFIIVRRYKTGTRWEPHLQCWPTTEAGLRRSESDDTSVTVTSPAPSTTITTPSEVAVVLTNGTPVSSDDDDSNIYSNECSVPDNTWIAVDQLEKHVESFDQSLESVQAEYKSIPTEKDHPRKIGQNPKLSIKNRFKNIQPYDHNIVKLSIENNDDADAGYINASWVEDHSGERHYIASQGPVKQTVNDFWKMVWEHNVCVIAMLTNPFEKNKRKCEVYWPEDGCITKGQVTVTFVHQDIFLLMTVRNFLVSHTSNPTRSRSINQYHFTSWPDHGVPDQCTGLIRFYNKVRAAEVVGCPTLVHCSAGVGRTGTFIGLDLSMRQAASEGGIDIRACVDRMREYRMHMVQNVEQYIFLYRVVSECLLLAGTTIPCHLLEETYLRKKSEHCLDGSMTQLRKEIEMLNKSIDSEDDYKTANLAVNKKLNRTKIIPKDKARVRLMVPVDARGDYINAVFVKGYKARGGTIATQYPISKSVVDFWRMITDYRINSIIVLEEPDSTEIAPCKSNRVLKLPHVTIQWQGHSDKGPYSQTTLSVLATQRQKSSSEEEPLYMNQEQTGRQVRVFTARASTNNSHGIPLATLLELRRETESWQAEKKTSNSPTVVVCRDGALYCGWYIAANIALDMMHNEAEVDIFFIVRQLKATRKEFISKLSEYESLLALAVEHQKQCSDSDEHTYDNIC